MRLLHLTQDYTVSARHPIAHLFTKWRLLTQKTNLLSVGLTLWRSAPSAISSTILSYFVKAYQEYKEDPDATLLEWCKKEGEHEELPFLWIYNRES